jgi:hypothetical protein
MLTIKYIPLSFTEPRRRITIEVSQAVRSRELSAIVSQQIGRDVRVILGVASYNAYMNWTVADDAIPGKSEILAFETSGARFAIVCAVRLRVVTETVVITAAGNQQHCIDTELSGPFLLEFDRPDVTPEEIECKAGQALESVWTTNFKPTSGITAFLTGLPSWDKVLNTGSANRFQVLPGEKATPDWGVKGMAHEIVHLTVNKTIATQDKQFSMAALVRHVDMLASSGYALEVSKRPLDIDQCLKLFAMPDELDSDNMWRCPKCCEFVCARKKMDIWSVPNCLIIHLKRFTAQTKVDVEVRYPDQLDLKDYVVGPQRDNERPLKYRLYGVSEHFGGLRGGHYTAHVKVVPRGQQNGNWFKFDDSYCAQADEKAAHNAAAYLLFYQREG